MVAAPAGRGFKIDDGDRSCGEFRTCAILAAARRFVQKGSQRRAPGRSRRKSVHSRSPALKPRRCRANPDQTLPPQARRSRDMNSPAREILRRVFGYPDFRGQQEKIVSHVAGGGDALVLMPTGGGKSLCYQIPALLREGVGVVVSPLIALMQDQVEALLLAGVRAAFL